MVPACLLALAASLTAWPDPPPPRPAPTATIAPSPALAALDHLPRLDPARSSTRPGPLGHVMPAEYLVDLPARSRAVYLLPPGPKVVREIVVVPERGTADAWRQARLKIAWETDDPAHATVDLPLGVLFGRFGGRTAARTSSVLAGTADAWSCRWPMPYRSDAVLEIRTTTPLAGRLRVMTTAGLPDGLGRFWAAELPAGRWERAGRGQLVGLLLVAETTTGRAAPDAAAASWQLRRDDQSAQPLGAAFGLDGDEAKAGVERGEIPAASGRAAAFCWRIAQPLAYDRALIIENRPSGDSGEAGSASSRPASPDASSPRAILFGYEAAPARPGARP